MTDNLTQLKTVTYMATATATQTVAPTGLYDCLGRVSRTKKTIKRIAKFVSYQCKSKWSLTTGNANPMNTYASPTATPTYGSPSSGSYGYGSSSGYSGGYGSSGKSNSGYGSYNSNGGSSYGGSSSMSNSGYGY